MRHLIIFVSFILTTLPLKVTSTTLQQIWNFSAPALRDPQLDPNGLRINVLYNVSDFIIPTMVNYSVSNHDCNVSVEEWFVPSLIQPTQGFVQGDGSGDGVIEVEINVDPDSFATATGDIASYWQEEGEERYRVKFCLFTGVQTLGDNPRVVDSSETQITVSYDLSSGFALAVEIAPVINVEEVSEAYKPEGYWCDAETGRKLTDDELVTFGAPGAELSVCVVPDEEARNAGLSLDQIDSFAWVREDPSGMRIEQFAIQDGQSVDLLTELVCNDEGCGFKSILQAGFFQENLPTPAPTQSPTPEPTPEPTPAPTETKLVNLGANPPGTLFECEGDCDSDSQCAGSLVCYQRDVDDFVPGCGNYAAEPGYDFCFNPSNTINGNRLKYKGLNPDIGLFNKLGECEGDCDSDSDCGVGLSCFQRSSATEAVPGCGSGGIGTIDYCYRTGLFGRALGQEEDEALQKSNLRVSQEAETLPATDMQVSSLDNISNRERSLQTGERPSIGGIGVATLKLGRRKYRRDLQTGEETWEIVHEKISGRQLQVQGGGSFGLSPRIPLQAAPPRRYASSACATAQTTMLLLSAVLAFVSI